MKFYYRLMNRFPRTWFFLTYKRIRLRCEHCKTPFNLEIVGSQRVDDTNLHENDYNNPTRKLLLCNSCAQDYTKWMDEQWEEYYHGRM